MASSFYPYLTLHKALPLQYTMILQGLKGIHDKIMLTYKRGVGSWIGNVTPTIGLIKHNLLSNVNYKYERKLQKRSLSLYFKHYIHGSACGKEYIYTYRIHV